MKYVNHKETKLSLKRIQYTSGQIQCMNGNASGIGHRIHLWKIIVKTDFFFVSMITWDRNEEPV